MSMCWVFTKHTRSWSAVRSRSHVDLICSRVVNNHLNPVDNGAGTRATGTPYTATPYIGTPALGSLTSHLPDEYLDITYRAVFTERPPSVGSSVWVLACNSRTYVIELLKLSHLISAASVTCFSDFRHLSFDTIDYRRFR